LRQDIHFFNEFRRLSALALPIILSGVVNSVMPFVNTVYLGHLSEEALAIGGLSLSIFVFIMVLFWGMFSTLSPLIARLHGEKQDAEIASLVRAGLLLSLPTGLLIILVYHHIGDLLLLFNYSPYIASEVQHFFITLSFSTPADLMLTTLYAFCFGISKPRYVLIVTIVQIPINLFFNYMFMYGDFGAPAFGISGIGVGMTCTYWLIFSVFVAFLFGLHTPRRYLCGGHKVRLSQVWEILKVGGPSGIQWLLTMGFFAVVALLMGRLSLAALAAYQVVFQIYTLVYNIVYNFNQAVTIRVAEGVGARLVKQVRYNYWGSYLFIGFVLLITLLCIGFGHESLIHLFTKPGATGEEGFFAYAREFLFLLPIFMIIDLLGYTHFQVLRSFKDTRFPMLVALVVYWVIGIPLLILVMDTHSVNSPMLLWGIMIFSSLFCLLGQAWRYVHQYKQLKVAAGINKQNLI